MMKNGSMVYLNPSSFSGTADTKYNPLDTLGMVIDYDPVWVTVMWTTGVKNAYEEAELLLADITGQPVEEVEEIYTPAGYTFNDTNEYGCGKFDDSFVREVVRRVNAYHETYLEKHPHDWDCCGFASVSIEFGRKRKLKEQVEALGFDVGYKSGTSSIMSAKFSIPNCGHQSLTYKENVTQIVCDVINETVGENIARVNSYMD